MRLDANGVVDRAGFDGYVSFGFAGLGYLVGRDWVDEDGNYIATIVRTEMFAATATSVIALWSQSATTEHAVDSWITATEIPFGATDGTTTRLPAAHMSTRTITIGCSE